MLPLNSPKAQGGQRPFVGTFGGTVAELNRTQLLYRDIGVQYKTNGGGRDTYIFGNNGGFSQEYYNPSTYDKPGTMLPNIRKRVSPEKRPNIHSKSVYYRQDGSGRDSYIMVGNGGYCNPGKIQEFRVAFKNSLRQYEPKASSPRQNNIQKKNLQIRARHLLLKDSEALAYRTLHNLSPGTAANDRSINNFTSPLSINESIENMRQKIQASPRGATINQNIGGTTNEAQQNIANLSASIELAPNVRNSFEINRFSATCASKFVIDNPKIEHQVSLGNYQRFLDDRLAQPKRFSPTRSPYLERNSPSPQRLSPKNSFGGDNISQLVEKTLSAEKAKQNPYSRQIHQNTEIYPASLHFLTKSSGIYSTSQGKLVNEVDFSNGNELTINGRKQNIGHNNQAPLF